MMHELFHNDLVQGEAHLGHRHQQQIPTSHSSCRRHLHDVLSSSTPLYSSCFQIVTLALDSQAQLIYLSVLLSTGERVKFRNHIHKQKQQLGYFFFFFCCCCCCNPIPPRKKETLNPGQPFFCLLSSKHHFSSTNFRQRRRRQILHANFKRGCNQLKCRVPNTKFSSSIHNLRRFKSIASSKSSSTSANPNLTTTASKLPTPLCCPKRDPNSGQKKKKI